MLLDVGDKAPPFDLESDAGGRVSLRDFAGKTLVLYFYPRDSTPGCTRQAQAFTAARRAIEAAGGAIVGVSRDSIKSHASFRSKYDLGITLVSDPDASVHRAYGAWGEKTMYGRKMEGVLRTTFLVKNGTIARVFRNVKVDGHADAVLEAMRQLSSPSPKAKANAAKPKATAAKAKATAAKANANAAKTKATGAKAKATAAKPKATAAKAKTTAAKTKAGRAAAKSKARRA